jgi:DNA-binding transcriptional ArsR family regulator
MESYDAINALSALAQEARLGIFRLLVEAGPAGLPVGDIGTALELPGATLSFHLTQLKHSGLVTCRRRGRQLIHAADFARMNDLIGYLTENCCGGNVAASGPTKKSKPKTKSKPKR